MSGIRFEQDGQLGRVIFEKPPVNVLDIAALTELAVLFDTLGRDKDLKVVTIAGSGKAFCAGLDVADHLGERVERMLTVFHDAIRRLRALPMPVIALTHGATLGGGLEIALACDIILTRSDARLGQPEIKLGAIPPVAAALMPRVLGRQRALDLILTGRLITGDEALTMGLVAHAWPADDYATRAEAYVKDLLTLSTPVLRIAKHATAAWLDIPFVPALENAERVYLDELMRLGDAHEGISAFLQKRAPVWSNA